MKKIMLTFLWIAFTLTNTFAQKNNVSISENNGKTSISIKDSKQKLDLKVKGDVIFTEDEKGIKSLSSNGSLSYKKGKNKLKISQEKNGSLLYVINGTTKSVPDAKDEALIAACVQMLIDIGINGKERAHRIYSKSGFNSVLKEVDRFESDYVKSIYLKALSSNPFLSDDEILSLLEKIDLQLTSDYYKSEIIKNLLNREHISDVQFEQFMKMTSHIKSDYYQSEILLSLLKNTSLTETRYSQTISAIQNMKSSYYQATVLQSLINENVKEETEWMQLIAYTKKIDSDYYKSEVLKKIFVVMPDSETLKKKFMKVAETINSDYYYRTVVRAMRD